MTLSRLHQLILHVEAVSSFLARSSFGIMIQLRLNRPILHVEDAFGTFLQIGKYVGSSVGIMIQSRYPMVRNFLANWNDMEDKVWPLPCFNHFQLSLWCSGGLYPGWPIIRLEDLSQGGAIVLNSTTRWHWNFATWWFNWGSGEVLMGIWSKY